MVGKIVTVTIDRPLGTRHPNHPDILYPVNYGYIPGIMAPDGEEQDAYILGVEVPVAEFTGEVIAIVRRMDDVEDKWVVAPVGTRLSREEIQTRLAFQERYFHSEILLKYRSQIKMPDAAPASGILYSFSYIDILHRHGKLVFIGLSPNFLSLRTSALKWCGNPPVERNPVTISTKNRGKSQSSWKFSEHFCSNRGIATTSLRTGLAMTGNLESARQTPICRVADENR